MKKSILIGVVSFLCMFTTTFAQTNENSLEGIWQFCEEKEKVDGEKVLVCSPIWKFLSDDGKFSQFMLMYQDGTCALTHGGTYKIEPPHILTENILSHAVDKDLIGTRTRINYHFLNEDLVEFTFNLQGRNKEYREVWKRVKFYIPPKK